MTELCYVIPLTPVSKKNSQQIVRTAGGRPFIMPSKQYRAYEEAAAWYLRPRPPKPITEPVNVCCVFYMPTRRLCDLSNLEEAAHDVLVRCGVLADDNRDIVATTDGSMVLYDKDHPRTEITITAKEGWQQWRKR